jgi:hypothetical protein
MTHKSHQFQPHIDGMQTYSANVSLRLTEETRDKLYLVKDWKHRLREFIRQLTDDAAAIE